MPTIGEEIANLTATTQALLDAVNVGKTTLDTKVADAAAEALVATQEANSAYISKVNAAASESQASLSETNAAISETNAASSATAALNSAINASTSATAAGTSETNAATSEANSATSELNAANSATAAGNSAISASASATSASTDKSAAATSASSASTSASSASTHATTAQTAAAALANYTSMTSLERALPTKAEFNAMAEERKANRAGSGFDKWGARYKTQQSNLGYINEGMWLNYTIPNILYLGRSTHVDYPTLDTPYPFTSINGITQHIKDVNPGYVGDGNKITLPTAPTVTHADASNSGMVLNGRNMVDLSGWTNQLNANLSIVNSSIRVVPTETNSGMYQYLTTVIGVEYTVEVETENAIGTMNFGVSGTSFTSNLLNGRSKYTFVATTTASKLDIIGTLGEEITIKNIFCCPSHELSRSDLVFLETWHEDISEKDFVYPLGNIQYLGADTDGLTGIVAGAFAGKETYSNFGNWQASNALVGKGYVWSTMSEANKIKFVSNPENNCYIDGTTIVQVRYRVRVVQGLGDSWFNAGNTQDSTNYTLSYTGANPNHVASKGKLTSVTSDLTSTGAYGVFQNKYGSYNTIIKLNNGEFKAGTTTGDLDGVPSISYNGDCYALPIALVHRRNQGAYHPKFNPNGTKGYNDATGNSSKNWYDSLVRTKPKSIADTFNFPTSLYPYSDGIVYPTIGNIGTSSYRPDGLFYDQIAERDIIDLRNSSHKVQDYKRLLEREFNKAVAGTVRGSEGEWDTDYYTEDYSAFNAVGYSNTFGYGTSSTYINMVGDTLDLGKYNIGGNLVFAESLGHLGLVKGGSKWYKIARAYYNSAIPGTTIILHPEHGDVRADFTDFSQVKLFRARKSTRKKSNTLTHCDIIGNPANYYRGQTFTNTGASQVVDIVQNKTVVWNKDGNDVNGLNGHFYLRIGASATGADLSVWDLSNIATWQDLGTDWDGAGSWRTGVSGTPLVVGENGEDYLGTGTKTIKHSKKITTMKLGLYSTDYGVTWNVSTSTINSTANTADYNLGGSGTIIWLSFYETHTNMAENTVNSEVIELGDVYAGNNWSEANFIQSLLNKVVVAAAIPVNLRGNKVGNYAISTLKFRTESGNTPVHNALSLYGTASVNTALKTLPYITKQNNKAYLNLVFKEMKHNGTSWGDDSKFNIVDNVSTTTDLNAQTVLIGQKRIELPYFIEDKE